MHGIHTALVTPFTDDGRVDYEAFEALCARQVDAGIHGLVPCGTTGETPTLTGDEVAQLLTATVGVADGRVPVTVGVGTNATASTVANCVQAKDLGATAGLLVMPYYNKPNQDGIRRHVAEAAATGLPLVLYNIPGRTAQPLPASFVAELCEQSGVIGLKEATGDLRFGTDVMQATSTPVLSGDDFSFLALLAQGGAGCISVVSNVAPAHTVGVYNAYRQGRTEEALAQFQSLWKLVTFLFSDSNPVPCKAALAAMGLCGLHTRSPLTPWRGPLPTELVKGLA
jgi:4-hydroxy-tetrahydrodipicolinate synthase